MTDDRMTALQRAVADFAAARDWQQFHDPKNLVMALASEVGELVAVLRWIPNSESDSAVAIDPVRRKLLDEIGDVGILLLQLCARLDVNFEEVVLSKLAINNERYPIATSRGQSERPHPTDLDSH